MAIVYDLNLPFLSMTPQKLQFVAFNTLCSYKTHCSFQDLELFQSYERIDVQKIVVLPNLAVAPLQLKVFQRKIGERIKI